MQLRVVVVNIGVLMIHMTKIATYETFTWLLLTHTAHTMCTYWALVLVFKGYYWLILLSARLSGPCTCIKVIIG